MRRNIKMTPTATISVVVGRDDVEAYLRVRVAFDPGIPRWQGAPRGCPPDTDAQGVPPTVEAIEALEAVEEIAIEDGAEWVALDGDDPLVHAAAARELLPLVEQTELDEKLADELESQADDDAALEEYYRVKRRYDGGYPYYWRGRLT